MKIGIPKELKNNENRVGMTPAGVAELKKHGHTVYVQHTAGENSGFCDEEYINVGAEILPGESHDVQQLHDLLLQGQARVVTGKRDHIHTSVVGCFEKL